MRISLSHVVHAQPTQDGVAKKMTPFYKQKIDRAGYSAPAEMLFVYPCMEPYFQYSCRHENHVTQVEVERYVIKPLIAVASTSNPHIYSQHVNFHLTRELASFSNGNMGTWERGQIFQGNLGSKWILGSNLAFLLREQSINIFFGIREILEIFLGNTGT